MSLSCSLYRQVGAVRDAYKGRKVWFPPEDSEDAKGTGGEDTKGARLGLPPTLPWEATAVGRFRTWLGPRSAMSLSRSSTVLQRQIALTCAFKRFFRDNSFELCSKIAGFLGKQRLGCLR